MRWWVLATAAAAAACQPLACAIIAIMTAWMCRDSWMRRTDEEEWSKCMPYRVKICIRVAWLLIVVYIFSAFAILWTSCFAAFESEREWKKRIEIAAAALVSRITLEHCISENCSNTRSAISVKRSQPHFGINDTIPATMQDQRW